MTLFSYNQIDDIWKLVLRLFKTAAWDDGVFEVVLMIADACKVNIIPVYPGLGYYMVSKMLSLKTPASNDSHRILHAQQQILNRYLPRKP